MKFDTNGDIYSKHHKVTIEIDNLTEAQAIAIEEYMAAWKFISEKKFFYWAAMAIDGFVDWAPNIKVNGHEPQRYMGDIGIRSGKVKFVQGDGLLLDEEMYFLDYYKIHKKLEEEQNGTPNE